MKKAAVDQILSLENFPSLPLFGFTILIARSTIYLELYHLIMTVGNVNSLFLQFHNVLAKYKQEKLRGNWRG